MWNDLLPNKLTALMHTLKSVDQSLYTPKYEDVLKAFKLCSPEDCKVVILGQDPYPQEGVATGIAFANDIIQDAPEIMSPSLKVIRDSVLSLAKFGEFPTFDPSLESWEKQGILLLNSSLTVHINKPNSHKNTWKPAMEDLVKNISKYNPKIFWILFGSSAWEYENLIVGSDNIITEYHPAYFARKNLPMGNWVWRTMLKYVKDTFGVSLQLWK